MSRLLRVSPPPPVQDPALAFWLSKLADAINGIPNFVMFSGDPNASNISASTPTLGFDIASGSTQKLWLNTAGTPSSWSTINYG